MATILPRGYKPKLGIEAGGCYNQFSSAPASSKVMTINEINIIELPRQKSDLINPIVGSGVILRVELKPYQEVPSCLECGVQLRVHRHPPYPVLEPFSHGMTKKDPQSFGQLLLESSPSLARRWKVITAVSTSRFVHPKKRGTELYEPSSIDYGPSLDVGEWSRPLTTALYVIGFSPRRIARLIGSSFGTGPSISTKIVKENATGVAKSESHRKGLIDTLHDQNRGIQLTAEGRWSMDPLIAWEVDLRGDINQATKRFLQELSTSSQTPREMRQGTFSFQLYQ